MYPKPFTLFYKSILLLVIVLLITECKRPQEEIKEIDPAFTSYVSAFTSGHISKESAIRVRLTEEYQGEIEFYIHTPVKLFKFSPQVKGKTYWIDRRTVEFRPDENLKSGTLYTVSFNLSKVMDTPEDLKQFDFQFKTIKQSFAVDIENLKTYRHDDLRWNKLIGNVTTADVIEENKLTKILSAYQGKNKLQIRWDYTPDGKIHAFQIDSIQRKESEEVVNVKWDGSPIDVEITGSKDLIIPSLGDFKVMHAVVVHQPEQYLLLRFSDPLLQDQYLEGLIRLENGTDLQYIIEDNEIRAYPAVRQTGNIIVSVESGIKNVLGYKLRTRAEITVNFEEVKPAVRLLGQGVILPNSEGLIFPFEAVNLKAVDVRIIRIFENNVGQFLQVNSLDGSDQLKRVGRLIVKKTVNLTSEIPIDFGNWNTFSFDLRDLIESEPGAIYRIEIGFKKRHSLFPCEGEEETTAEEMEEIAESDYDEDLDTELSYWDSYESYYEDDYYYWDYDWSERDDPCSDAYYGDHRKVARNILASDLGIIAKGGTDKSVAVIVSDLKTTDPIPNVSIDIFNYQRQLLGSARTDGNGIAFIDLTNKPFLLIAKHDNQRGYLRLDDGSSLSLSKYDVSGSVVQRGIKGYLYGERGVWRPGDTLFLTFMLEDKNQILPESHPVIFELINPHNQLVTRLVKTTGNNGFYSFITHTDQDAPTGNWTAKVQVGGSTFTTRLRIETVKPNRLKINLDFGTERLSVSKPEVRGQIAVVWLHGAIAQNLRTHITATLTQTPTRFDRYSDYVFDDPVRTFYSEEHTIYDGRLDQDGKAVFSTDISVGRAAPGMLRAHFITRVFEESGEFSIDRFSIPYSPYTSYVGIKSPKGDKARGMLLTDTTHIVDLVTLDTDGNPISRDNLEVKIYKIHWRWWWDASYDDLASYVGSSQHTPIFSKTTSTRRGKGQFTFKIEYPDWGRYLIRVVDPASGHASGKIVYIDWPGWAGRAQREHPGGAAMLSFNADKQKYTVGEMAIISIPSSGQGRALISIENGSRVLNAYWAEAREPETNFSFKITEDMTPNIYVNVSLVQPHAQSVNDLPIRLYGVIPLLVEDPETRLHPTIQMPDILQPEDNIILKISDENNVACSYTIAIVDEGLLDLTRFRTPDPWSHFYAREALGVKTWDVYDAILGAYGGKIEQIFSIGGGYEEEGEEEAQSRATRFPPMVKFLGPFELKKGQTNTHQLLVPQYIGSVKTMVVAGNQKAYGSTEKVTPVRKPLMVLATLPRVLGPEEEFQLPVTVFAMENNIKNVNVEVVPNEYFVTIGETKKIMTFNKPGDQLVEFRLKVIPGIGIGKVKITASSGSNKAEYNIELDIRNPNPPVTEFIDAVIDPGKEWNNDYKLPGIQGTNKATLEISNIPTNDFGRRLKYLIRYPHGCVEQITSAAFPQLFLGDIVELSDETRKKTEDNIKAAIKRLNTFMLPGGGLGYWPNSQEPNDWGTSYAGHYMLEAEKQGFVLPFDFKKKWLGYQKNTAKQWKKRKEKYRQDDLLQAYRLYTLALANQPELGAMNRLREQPDLTIQARWRLAATYALAGQPEAANELIANITAEIEEYSAFNYSYGSRERDIAMILETFTLMDKRSEAVSLVQKISKDLSSNKWMSTQTTAYCLLAISKFAGSEAVSKQLTFEYSIHGAKNVKASTKRPVAQIEMDVTNRTKGQVRVINKGEGVIFARITMEGIPKIGDQSADHNNLNMTVSYTDMNGYNIDVSSLSQGFDFLAHVTISNPGSLGNYRDIALTQIFPSGWEIHNVRMDDFQSVHSSDIPTYQDIRDDRVYTYFDINSYRSKTFTLQLNAAYQGKFYLPTVYCEAMYEARVNAKIPGKWVEVRED